MYDLSYPISPNKALTKEGFLICRNAVIASIGAREYALSETNEVKPNAEGKVFIMRPSDVLFSDDTINSLEGKPVTLGHPPVDSVTGDNWKQYAVGSISHVRKGEGHTAGCLVADLMIFEPKAIEAVFNGVAKELSCGFKSNVIDQGGGIGIETNFIGNHVALVPQGKGGATCSLKDSVITKEDTDMAFFKKDAAPADVNAQILQQLQAMSERLAALEKSAQAQSPAPATNADEAKKPEPNATQTPAPDNKAAETPAPTPDDKKADDDMPPAAPNPLAGIDPAVLGAAILQALTDAKADKKADEKKADECKKEEAKKDAKPETKLDAMIGVVVRYHEGWTLQVFPQEIGVLSTGYIQVPAAASITPKRNQPVYYDATNQVFTTDNTKVPIRAVFAANGIADGCAEIQVTQQVVIPVKSTGS